MGQDPGSAARAPATLAGPESDVALRDGATVHIRPVRPGDEERLLAFLRGLSQESRTLRFFSPAIDLVAEARRESAVADGRRLGLVATVGPEEEIAAHALCIALDGRRAEVALTVGDAHQGQGLGTLLLGQLAEAAAAGGLDTFEADVLAANHRMLDVFRQSGFPLEVREYLCLTLTLDHDLIDGAPAARFARRLTELIESGAGLPDQARVPAGGAAPR